MANLRLLVGVTLLTASCASASQRQLLARASSDLRCNKGDLTVVELDAQTRGVSGCGKRQMYLESCNGRKDSPSRRCTWVSNSHARDDED